MGLSCNSMGNFVYWFVFILDLLTRQTLKCDGPSKDMRSCNENDCPSWTPWSEWSQCSFTCGGGTCTRERKCRLPDGTKVPNEQCTDGKHKILDNQRSVNFKMFFWCLQISQKTNEIFSRISALASKKRSNQNNKGTLYRWLEDFILTLLHYFFDLTSF